MITFEHLLEAHKQNSSQIVAEYIQKYIDLPYEKTPQTLAMFIVQNARDVASAIAISGTEAIHQLMQTTSVQAEHVEAVLSANVGAAMAWQEQIMGLYQQVSRG